MKRMDSTGAGHGAGTGAGQGGFTLLEVMIATMLLAVGSVSVIMMLTSAIGFSNKRQGQQRLAQVLEEARFDAQSVVNAFVPTDDKKLPGDEDGKMAAKTSALFAGYSFQLTFRLVNAQVPDAGFETDIVVSYGDGLTHEDAAIVAPKSIPADEFKSSATYDAERKATQAEGARETR